MYKTPSELREAYNHIAELKQLEKDYETKAKTFRVEWTQEILQYRMDSVCRILCFLKEEYNRGRLYNLDMLLTHCLNKLNGNIDKVELDLESMQAVGTYPKKDNQ